MSLLPFGANIIPHHQECDKVLSALREKRFYTSPGDTLATHPPPSPLAPHLSPHSTFAARAQAHTQSSFGRAEIWKKCINKNACVLLKCGRVHQRAKESETRSEAQIFFQVLKRDSRIQIPQVAYLQVSGFAPFIPQWSPRTSALCVVYAAARE